MASNTAAEPQIEESKRPKDTKFKQQKLPAWQPILTAGTVLPAFFAIGIAFIPLGVALLVTSDSVKEVVVDYTRDCKPTDTKISHNYSDCAKYLEDYPYSGKGCPCTINITLEEDFQGQVYIYYGLSNYYQNHRRYVKSRDDAQLKGDSVSSYKDLSGDCDPYRYFENGTAEEIPYAPCGAIANSLFNDSITLLNEKGLQIPVLNTGIAWATDKDVKFGNPDTFDGTLHPPYWQKNVSELDPDNPDNNGYENEDLIVWMRTAALPTFRKLYRRVDHKDTFKDGLKKGTYKLDIEYNYPVTMFDGTKRVIVTTTSWMGGKNPFLGIAYLVVGTISIVLGIIFLVIHIKIGKKACDIGSSSKPEHEIELVPVARFHGDLD